MSARWWTLGVWALAAAGAAFWGLRLFVAAAPVPSHARTAEAGPPARGDLTRLFGADAPPPTAAAPELAADARFQLIGVLSPRAPQAAREGVALIVVDGKPARAFRVGAVVEGQNVLKSVNARGATLGPREGGAMVALNLAPPAPAATGTMPPIGSPGAAPPPYNPAALPRLPMAQPNGLPQVGQNSRRHPPNAPESLDPSQSGPDTALTR